MAAGLEHGAAIEAVAELGIARPAPEDAFQAATEGLPPKVARAFACDCAERTLAIWVLLTPPDPRPRLAVEAARNSSSGTIGADALAEAERGAEAASWCSNPAFSRAADAARLAASQTPLASECALASRQAKAFSPPPGLTPHEAHDAELRWQSLRLATYLLA